MDMFEVEPGHDRVRDHTGAQVQERIDRLAKTRVEALTDADPFAIGRRLEALDREWDLDRALMTNFALVGGFAFLQGWRRVRDRRKRNGWFLMLAGQLGFLLLHSLVGWCPPTMLFRRLGIRTSKEIGAERQALVQLLARRGMVAPGAART